MIKRNNSVKKNSHQEMTFICEGKNKNFAQCNEQNFTYHRHFATGAQVFEENKYEKY